MPNINYWAVGVAALVAFVASFVWYIIFGKARAQMLGQPASNRPELIKVVLELARNVVLAFVLAILFGWINPVGWSGTVQLAALLWIGFPVMILTGSVQWEKVPWKLAAIHAGDWLLKLLLITLILGMSR